MKNNIKLRYRPLRRTDLSYRRAWLNDPETNQYLGTRVRQGTNLAFHERWFDAYQKDASRQILTVTSGAKPIGQVGLLSINKEDHNAELYILIGDPSFRGRGLGKVLVSYITDYGFQKLGLHRIFLTVHAANLPAIRLYEHCGFQHEGKLRESVLRNGNYEDEIMMGRIYAISD